MISIDSRYVFGALAAIVLVLALRAMRRWQLDAKDSFDVRDLFMENGRASKGAVVLLGAFAATTWFFVLYAWTGKMTEGYFGLYSAAWVAPIVARVIFGDKPTAAGGPVP